MKITHYTVPLAAAVFALAGCSVSNTQTKVPVSENDAEDAFENIDEETEDSESSGTDKSSNTSESSASEEDADADVQNDESAEASADGSSLPETIEFTDVFDIVHTLTIDYDAAFNDYDRECFVPEGQSMSYTDTENYTYRLGIDVSYHQGEIDWDAVKEAGYDFVFIRIAYRGYGESGRLVEDEMFRENLYAASLAGLDTGVYFFSQALTEEEAAEEAKLTLELLDGVYLELPVVYDPEFILDSEGNRIDEARTSSLDGEQVTKNTIAFCELLEEAGYETAFYTNMLSESEVFDMTALSQYTVWYADYNEAPQTPYAFEYWQYSESGIVSGIDTEVDLDIQLIPVE